MSGEGDDQVPRPPTRNATPFAQPSSSELAWENEGGHLRNENARHRPGQSTVDELPPPAETNIAPHPFVSFRDELSTKDHDVVDASWAGAVPRSYGVAPRVRVGRDKWFNLLWLLPIGFVALIVGVAVAKGLREVPAVAGFVAAHPGTVVPAGAGDTAGSPEWVGWQHFFNMLLLIPIIRSGLTIIADHPRFYWTRHSTPGRDWFRVQKQVPVDPLWTAKQDSITLPDGVGLPGRRHSIGLARWWHLGVNTLWLVNGLVFYVLVFATGHWTRLIPTSWDVFPNALSAMIQYLSLDWPTGHDWLAYNSLQLIAYFVTVFVASPLAFLTGLGM